MIKCPNCGFSNDDNCTFCAICGSSVTQDDFYVHNTTSAGFSVEELTKKLISKDKEENAKTKSFKKLDKATIAKEAAKIENDTEKVKEYKGSSEEKANKTNQSAKNTDDDIKIRTNTNSKANTDTKKAEAVTNKDINQANKSVEKEVVTNTSDKTTAEKKNEKPVATKESNTKTAVAEENKSTTLDKDTSTKAEPKSTEKQSTKPTAKADTDKSANTDVKSEQSKAEKSEEATATQGSTDSKLYNLLSTFFFGTKNNTALFKQNDIDENCNLAIISYIPFLFFVPMIIKPCSGYLRYHGIQGLTMFLSFIVLEFFDIILSAICNSIFNDMVGIILTVIITVAINITVLLLISIGIANAVKGEARELPIIGKYKLLKQYIYW